MIIPPDLDHSIDSSYICSAMNKETLLFRRRHAFFVPPSPGFSFRILDTLMWRNYVHPKYYPKALGSYLLNFINAPFRWYEKRFIDPKILKEQIHVPPVFIIGHWRSGTTHLHNLLTRNPHASYVTTYQSVFPHTMETRVGKSLFSWFMHLVIPPTRIADSMKLSPELPEEEEFALGMGVPVSYYFFWLFPKKTKEYYKRFVEFSGLSESLIKKWRRDYSLLIRKAIRNRGGELFISKNPSNTGRIKELLYLFPDARFVFIHRHPFEVFPSTIHLQQKLLPRLEYHHVSERKTEDNILYVYKKIMQRYLKQRHLIPPENLLEVRYDDLKNDPMKVIRNIYQKFNFPEQEAGLKATESYLEQTRNYKKNKLSITPEQRERVEKELDFIFKEWY